MADNATTDGVEETPKPKFEAFGKTFEIDRRPPLLLISEMSNVDEGDARGIRMYAEFFTTILSSAEYRKFKAANYAAKLDTIEDEMEAMQNAVEAVMESLEVVTEERPTK